MTISNFRLFRHLQVDNLARVNVFVGRNNSGKSALLEAVEVYARSCSITTLRKLLTFREERWAERGGDSAMRHLFYNRSIPGVDEPGIIMRTSTNGNDDLQLVVAAYVQEEEEGVVRRRLLTADEALLPDTEVELAYLVKENARMRRVARVDQQLRSPALRDPPDFRPRYAVQTVRTRGISPEDIAALWDRIALTDLSGEVIAGLRLLVPSIEGVAYVKSTLISGDSDEGRTALIRTSESSEPVPLQSMGDGMMRMFHISLALANARDGILLVDEFENGLHWSVQPSVWTSVFRLAVRLNVQVFATTHSRDCVASFKKTWQENPDLGAFYRMQVSADGATTARRYALETLDDSLESDVEVR
ncbi:MAG: AAA family ATPase [Capsulimonadaceae bacterium]